MWFYYDAGGQRVAMDVGGTVYYYIYNLMGDVVGLYDGSGNVVARYAYDAWGKILSMKDGSGNAINSTATPDAPGVINPFRYRGYMYDDEAELYYLNSRYYDPETGRFVNVDDVNVLSEEYRNMVQYNLYTYCYNNPINMADDDGYMPFFVFTGIVGAIAGAVIGGVVAACNSENILAGIGIGAAAGGLIGLGLGAVAGVAFGGSITASSTAVITGAQTALSTAAAAAPILTSKVAETTSIRLSYSQSALKHLSSRPYMQCELLIQQIIDYGQCTKDVFLENGYKYLASGAINGTKGVWELVIDYDTNTIVHFLFNSRG